MNKTTPSLSLSELPAESSDTTRDLLERADRVFLNTYPLQPIVPERGEGCYLYDVDGRRYLDFAAGIAVAALGHAHPAFIRACTEQIAKFTICPASYATRPRVECAEFLVDRCCLDQVFFTNSGAEAVEGALKLVRKVAYDTKGPQAHEIVCFRQSFHGRTYGAVSITEKRLHHPFFEPYLPGVHFATFNDLDSVRAVVSKNTAAIFVEPVQGEGGIRPADPAFLKGLKDLAHENGAALVFDEVQVGMGRMGTLFAYEHFGVEPDVICLAKGLGGGFPVGAFLARKALAAHFTEGVHGTTYGGNPLATHVAHVVAREIAAPGFLDRVRRTARLLREGLEDLRRETNVIEDIRGVGLLVGIDTAFDVRKLLAGAQKNGLLATQAGERTFRMTPPLIVGPEHVDEALDVLRRTFREMG